MSSLVTKVPINPLYTRNSLTGTFNNGEDPDEMQYNAAFHQGLHCLSKKEFQVKNTIFFINCNLSPLCLYNGQSKFIVSNEKEEFISIQRVLNK